MKIISTLLFLCISLVSLTQIDNNQPIKDHDVFILGNLADNSKLVDLSTYLPSIVSQEKSFTLVLNGDLISADFHESQFKIFTDILLRMKEYPNGQLLIIQGDADWNFGLENGWDSVKDLEDETKSFLKKNEINNVVWVSKNGCPGPKDISVSPHLEVIALNSQWWNHDEDKPSPASVDCKFAETPHIKEEIEDLLEKNKEKNVLIIGHHPFMSYGNYGGYFSLKDHLTPFPILGSFKTAFHSEIGNELDISNENLAAYNTMMNEIMISHQNIIYASSHEKNQQIFRFRDNYLVNSGALFSSSHVSSKKDADLTSQDLGIIKLTYSKNGEVSSEFLNIDLNSPKFQGSTQNSLFQSACLQNGADESRLINTSFVPCENLSKEDSASGSNSASLESVSTFATQDYSKGFFHKIVFGTRYRKDWEQEITVPVLSLTSSGGLTPLKKGGGRQTTSLKLISENGDIYAFRSVNKDPSKALSYDVRNTLIGTLFKDQTSAQQPYGSLIIAPLLKPLDILHATPKLYVMPNDALLGKYQADFGDMLGTLEEHPGKENKDGELFGDADKIVKSNDLFSKLYASNKHQVDAKEFVRARLFDVLVGDWSKHEDNWKWAAYKEDGKTIYRPIPRDRDMVLSKWNGILPFIADLPFGITNIEGFDGKIRGFRSQVFQARFLDRYITTELTKDEFINEAKTIQTLLTDELILESVKALPKEVFDISGEEIIENLKLRRDDMVEYSIKFYDWLNKDVEIVGSNKKDFFQLEVIDAENLSVKVFDSKEELESNQPFYNRVFHSSETKQVRVYGLGKNDTYILNGTEKSKIKLVFLGGHGENSYVLPSSQTRKSVEIYDLDNLSDDSAPSKNHVDKKVYEYERGSLKFNSWIPSLSIGYSEFQGFAFGAGNTWTRHKWNKRNFSSKHSINGIYTSQNNSGLTYQGEWNEAIKKWNIKARGIVGNPNLTNSFYGIGNDTEFNRDLDTNDFFLTDYAEYSLNLGVSRRFWKKSELEIYTGYSQFQSNPKQGSFLETIEDTVAGANQTISSIPYHADLTLDFLDHSILPSDGVRLMVDSEYNLGLDNSENNFAFVSSSLEYYASSRNKNKLTLGLKVGGTKGFGDLPFYRQSNLGGDTGLRGYTSNRFTGESRAFLNSELRWQLSRKKNENSPAKFGLLAFYDTGRVFEKDEPINLFSDLNAGYGTGFYLVPYAKSFTLSFTLAWSEEESFYPGFAFGTFLN